MEQLARILSIHARRYPNMQPQDAVKLIFQNEFGPGHLIPNPESALRRLQDERSTEISTAAAPPLEGIGNGLYRISLPAWTAEEYPSECLNRDFVRSANLHTGNQDRFLLKLDVLRRLTQQGVFSFSLRDLETYLHGYIAAGCPAVSHSEVYRQAYHPSYRVVRQDCLSLSPAAVILKEISCRKDKSPLLIAIDGRCASGKTTLAAQLNAACGCGVVHMDDFFLRPQQRTRQRYETPGENVDHERFLHEVLLPLSRGEDAHYRPFDCSTLTLQEPVRLACSGVIVIEGSYSCHKALFPYYDLTVFLSLPPQKQMGRIIDRDGMEYAKVFAEKWIPLEEQYFAARRLETLCDFSFPCGSAAPCTEDN